MLVKASTEAAQTHRLEVDYQIVHSTAERLRICIPRLAIDPEYSSQLQSLVESLDFVTSVRVNPAAKSVVVHFNGYFGSGKHVVKFKHANQIGSL